MSGIETLPNLQFSWIGNNVSIRSVLETVSWWYDRLNATRWSNMYYSSELNFENPQICTGYYDPVEWVITERSSGLNCHQNSDTDTAMVFPSTIYDVSARSSACYVKQIIRTYTGARPVHNCIDLNNLQIFVDVYHVVTNTWHPDVHHLYIFINHIIDKFPIAATTWNSCQCRKILLVACWNKCNKRIDNLKSLTFTVAYFKANQFGFSSQMQLCSKLMAVIRW